MAWSLNKAEEDTDPVQVDDNGVLVAHHSSDESLRAKVAVEDQGHRCMGRATDNEEAANPLVMREQAKHRGIIRD